MHFTYSWEKFLKEIDNKINYKLQILLFTKNGRKVIFGAQKMKQKRLVDL